MLPSAEARQEHVRSFANNRSTPQGGTHLEGFRRGVTAAINACARRMRLLSTADADLSSASVSEGLTAVVSVKVDSPEFHGATRGGLSNTSVRSCMETAVREHLGTWLEEHPPQAATIITRIIQSVRDI
ncbi:hypothetical protein [Streptomyces sp. cg35]|uniref:hypothetical protein n=1 Tax=Streptomyces sp. cg35 TaxID=3421650 RepID=UPI003D1691FF